MVVDELESSMHPNLAEHIIRQFNDPEINTHNASSSSRRTTPTCSARSRANPR